MTQLELMQSIVERLLVEIKKNSCTNDSQDVKLSELQTAIDNIDLSALIDDTVASTDSAYSSIKVETLITEAITEVLGGADTDNDTLKELADKIVALAQADNGLVSAVEAQAFTDTEKETARDNIGASSQDDLDALEAIVVSNKLECDAHQLEQAQLKTDFEAHVSEVADLVAFDFDALIQSKMDEACPVDTPVATGEAYTITTIGNPGDANQYTLTPGATHIAPVDGDIISIAIDSAATSLSMPAYLMTSTAMPMSGTIVGDTIQFTVDNMGHDFVGDLTIGGVQSGDTLTLVENPTGTVAVTVL